MDEVAKTPQLQRRSNGIFYFRARVPADVESAVASNKPEWKRRTSTQGSPWKKLVAKDGKLKKEVSFSLETRERRIANRALPLKQVELHNLFSEVTRLLTKERISPTTKDVERLASEWFAGREVSRSNARPSPLETDLDVEDQLRQDVANAQSQLSEDQGHSQGIAKALLFKEEFVAHENSPEFYSLTQLIKRGGIELAKRSLEDYLGNYGQSYDGFFAATQRANGEIQSSWSSGYTLKQLIHDFMKDRKTLISSKTVMSYDIAFRVAKDVVGDATPVNAITRDHCRKFLEVLKHLPSNYTKYLELEGLDTVAASKRGSEIGLKAIAVPTAKGHFSKFTTLLDWAVNEDKISKNYALGLKVGKNPTAKKDSRDPFSLQDLRKIFAAPLFVGCVDDETNYNKSNASNRPRRARFWAQLISLFMGCRLNEILQMDVRDVEVT